MSWTKAQRKRKAEGTMAKAKKPTEQYPYVIEIHSSKGWSRIQVFVSRFDQLVYLQQVWYAARDLGTKASFVMNEHGTIIVDAYGETTRYIKLGAENNEINEREQNAREFAAFSGNIEVRVSEE